MLDLFGDGKATLRHLHGMCVLTPWAQEHGHVNQGVGFIRALANLAGDYESPLGEGVVIGVEPGGMVVVRFAGDVGADRGVDRVDRDAGPDP